MATWTDGPEYAPVERPAAFVAPPAESLTEQAATPPAEPAPPVEEPSFVAPQGPAPDLRELVPSAAPGRNPNLPFESMTTPIAAAPPTPLDRRPEEPFSAPGPSLTGYLPVQQVVQPTAQLNPTPFPAPGTPQWFAPPPGQPIRPAPAQVSLSQIWQATTSWVMIPLLIGMFVAPIAPIALAVSWLSSTQIRFRRLAIRRTYLAAGVAVAAISLISVVLDDTVSVFEPLAATALVACWILAIVIPAIVGTALRNHEPPDQL
jgi:hypothetical protein